MKKADLIVNKANTMKHSRHGLSGREKAESVIFFLAIALVVIAFTPIAEGDVLSEPLNSRRLHRLGFLFAATILLVVASDSRRGVQLA